MATSSIPPHLNSNVVRLWEDQFVCPNREIFDEHHGKTHPNFISPDWKVLGRTISPGIPVRLKSGRSRLVGQKIVQKPVGPARTVLTLRDYNYAGQFDEAAFRIQVGEKAKCQPYPAHRTAQFARVAEGVFSLDELT